MDHQSLIHLESPLWESKRIAEKNHIADGRSGIRRVIKRIKRQIVQQLAKEPKGNKSRKNREIHNMQQKNLLEELRDEEAAMCMILEDGNATIYEMLSHRLQQLSEYTNHLQPLEKNLNSFLSKSKIRTTGYTKTLVDALHDRTDEDDAVAERLWQYYVAYTDLLGSFAVPDVQLSEPSHILEYIILLHIYTAYFKYHSDAAEPLLRFEDALQLCIHVLQQSLINNEFEPHLPALLPTAIGTLNHLLLLPSHTSSALELLLPLCEVSLEWMGIVHHHINTPSLLSNLLSPHGSLLISFIQLARLLLLRLLRGSSSHQHKSYMNNIVACMDPVVVYVYQSYIDITSIERVTGISNFKLIDTCHRKIAEMMNYIAVCFNCGIVSNETLILLDVSVVLIEQNRSSMTIQSSFGQLMLSAILYVLMSPAVDVSKLRRKTSDLEKEANDETTEELVVKFLGLQIEQLVKILSAHTQSSSLHYLCLLCLRLLLRKPFMTVNKIEIFLESNTGHVDEDASVEGDTASVVSMTSITNWNEKIHAEENVFTVDDTHTLLFKLLHMCGESHLQSNEVMEQWLLLIRHMVLCSKLAKQALNNFGIRDIIQKIYSIQVDNVYLMALCEIVADMLLVE